MSNFPAPTVRYMPKNHAGLAREILDAAWQRYQETQFPEAERLLIGEIVAAELERRNPVADMDVLERYGLTSLEGKPETRDEYRQGERVAVETGKLRQVNVDCFNPHSGNWEGVGVEPARTVRVAGTGGFGRARLSGNTRAGVKPEPWGITPENVAKHKASGEWDRIAADNRTYYDKLVTGGLPPETDSFFQRVMDLRRAYREQYQAFHGWLESHRGGKYPTWAEIAERFPFIGEYLNAEKTTEYDL